MTLSSTALFALGLFLGGFYNAVARRVPRGQSPAFQVPHCATCGARLLAWDRVPVLGYLRLKGRCRCCGGRISPLYPAGELATAILFWWVFCVTGWRPELAVGLFFVSALVVASLGDAWYRLIPNRLVLMIFLGGIAARLLVPLPGGFWAAAAGILPGGLGLGLAALLSRGGMGEGDVKLAAALGLYVGWRGAVLAVFLGAVLGSVVGLGLILARVIQRRDPVPFGPFLAGGFLLAYLYGAQMMAWYGPLTFGR